MEIVTVDSAPAQNDEHAVSRINTPNDKSMNNMVEALEQADPVCQVLNSRPDTIAPELNASGGDNQSLEQRVMRLESAIERLEPMKTTLDLILQEFKSGLNSGYSSYTPLPFGNEIKPNSGTKYDATFTLQSLDRSCWNSHCLGHDYDMYLGGPPATTSWGEMASMSANTSVSWSSIKLESPYFPQSASIWTTQYNAGNPNTVDNCMGVCHADFYNQPVNDYPTNSIPEPRGEAGDQLEFGTFGCTGHTSGHNSDRGNEGISIVPIPTFIENCDKIGHPTVKMELTEDIQPQ